MQPSCLLCMATSCRHTVNQRCRCAATICMYLLPWPQTVSGVDVEHQLPHDMQLIQTAPQADDLQAHALSRNAACRPWLLEVNHSPSFTTDMAVDRRVKEALLQDTLQLVSNLSALSHDSDHKIQGHCRCDHGYLAIMQQGYHRPSRLPVGGLG